MPPTRGRRALDAVLCSGPAAALCPLRGLSAPGPSRPGRGPGCRRGHSEARSRRLAPIARVDGAPTRDPGLGPMLGVLAPATADALPGAALGVPTAERPTPLSWWGTHTAPAKWLTNRLQIAPQTRAPPPQVAPP